MSAGFYCYGMADETNEACVCALAPVSAVVSALAHCETAADEMASKAAAIPPNPTRILCMSVLPEVVVLETFAKD